MLKPVLPIRSRRAHLSMHSSIHASVPHSLSKLQNKLKSRERALQFDRLVQR